MADGIIASDAHQLLDTNHRQTAWHVASEDTTFYVATEFDDANDVLRVNAGAYNHTTNQIESLVEIDTTDLDRHYIPAIMVDGDGYLYVVYHARANFKIKKSTDPYDISSWINKPNIPDTRDYRQLNVINNELFVTARDGDHENADLRVARSADGAESWSTSNVFNVSGENLSPYPYDTVVEGNQIHIYLSVREATTGNPESVIHITYDIDSNTVFTSDGTDVGLSPSRADVDAGNSIIEDGHEVQLGAPMEIIDGDLNVAYLRGTEGEHMTLCHGVLTGETWDISEVETDMAHVDSIWNGARLALDADPLRVYETIRMSRGIDTTLGYWEYDPANGTWGSRQVERDFHSLSYGVHFPHRVQNGASEWMWMMSEVSDPDAYRGEAGDADLFAFTENFDDTIITE